MKGNALKQQNKSAVTSTPAKKSTKTVHQRLSEEGVAQFMINNNIRTEAKLMSEAKKREQAGEPDLQSFIITKPKRTLQELIERTWKMHEAPESAARDKLSRMLVIQKTLETECIECCSGTWLKHAREVLRQNHINVYVFGSAIRKLLTVGRQRNANILLHGPTNCGKSFLLNLFELIYKTFCNPAAGRYACVGLSICRWSSEIIAWNDLLLLLEGSTAHLPRPKNVYATNMEILRENTIPFFATTKEPITFVGKYNTRDERETDMMSCRWNMFAFTHKISLSEVKDTDPYPRCFAELVMAGADNE